jgi:hypothetical protein
MKIAIIAAFVVYLFVAILELAYGGRNELMSKAPLLLQAFYIFGTIAATVVFMLASLTYLSEI